MAQSSHSWTPIRKVPKLVEDYYVDETLKSLYQYPLSESGILQAVENKQNRYLFRESLAKLIEWNYADIEVSAEVQNNLNLLKKEALAVVCAHQPNLLLGPFYTISKAISTIALAKQFKNKTPNGCIPVFVIGSEDHDKAELLHFESRGIKYEWETTQEGAVGKMIVDKKLVHLIKNYCAEFPKTEYSEHLKNLFLESYELGNTLAKSYQKLMNGLFGKYGLVVLDLNFRESKQHLKAVFVDEIENSRVKKETEKTLQFLQDNHYPIQAQPSDINLFLLSENKREKIIKPNAESVQIVENEPERISPSVMLRPLMQEMILPSVAFVGGSAEVSYWLEQKGVFEYYGVPFPMIFQRDQFAVLEQGEADFWQSEGYNSADFFKTESEITADYLNRHESIFADLACEMPAKETFRFFKQKAETIDPSLAKSVSGLEKRYQNYIESVRRKFYKSMKRKHAEDLSKLLKIKRKVFHHTLTERVENFSFYYLKHGDKLFDMILKEADAFCLDLKFVEV